MVPAHFRTPGFRNYVLEHTVNRPRVIGVGWEALMYRALKATDPAAPLFWDPKSNRSGTDIVYRDDGYSLKTTTIRTRTSLVACLNSYKMARCKTDKDAILEIDRPHRHNFEWYSIWAWIDAVETQQLYILPSQLTLARRFDWDYTEGRLKTDVRDGVSMEIRKPKGKRMLWITMDFEAEALKEGRVI